MKKLLIAAGVIAGLLNSAWIAEGTSNNCAAYENLAMRKTMKKSDKGIGAGMAVALMRQSNGVIAAGFAAEQMPNVPTSVSCNLVYWFASLSGFEPKN